MRKTTAVLFAAFVSLMLSSVSRAQEKAAAAMPAPQKDKSAESRNAPATVLTGTVTLVDASAGKLTVKTRDKEVKLTADSKSARCALGKLKVGDSAIVLDRGGTLIAVSSVTPESTSKTSK